MERPDRYLLAGIAMVLSTLTLDAGEIPRNLAPAGTASASSTGWGGMIPYANDGNRDGTFANNSVWHTVDGATSHWWQVDLGSAFYLDRIQIFPRTGAGPYWTDFSLMVYDTGNRLVYSNVFLPSNTLDSAWGTSEVRGVRGRTVRIQCNGTPRNTSMAEFEVWGTDTRPSVHNAARFAALNGQVGGWGSTPHDGRDGDIDGDFYNPGHPVYHSNVVQPAGGQPLSNRFDIGSEQIIEYIRIYARSDQRSSSPVKVVVLDSTASPVFATTVPLDVMDLNALRYDVLVSSTSTLGRYVECSTVDSGDFLMLAEVEIFCASTDPHNMIINGDFEMPGGMTYDHGHNWQWCELARAGSLFWAGGFYGSVTPGGWSPQPYRDGVYYMSDNGLDVLPDGDYAMMLSPPTAGRAVSSISQSGLALVADGKYALTFDAWTSDWHDATVNVVLTGPDTITLLDGYVTYHQTPNGAVERIAVEFKPAVTGTYTLEFDNAGSGGDNDDAEMIWIDNVSLAEKPAQGTLLTVQ